MSLRVSGVLLALYNGMGNRIYVTKRNFMIRLIIYYLSWIWDRVMGPLWLSSDFAEGIVGLMDTNGMSEPHGVLLWSN